MDFLAAVGAALIVIAGLSALTAYLMARFVVHDEMKRRAEPYRPGQANDFATSEERGGIRRVVLSVDQTTAALIGARIGAAGIAYQLDAGDGGGEARGTSATTYTLLFQAADDDEVTEILRDVDERAGGGG